MNRAMNNGMVYSQTTILIPLDMKQEAKAAGISLAGTFRKALKAELEAHNGAANKNNPAQPNHEQTGNTASQGGAV